MSELNKPSGLFSFLPSFDSPSVPPGSTTIDLEQHIHFAGIFNAILQDAAQRAYMETEGMYTAAEEAFETAQRDLRDIQFTVPQDEQADALAEYLQKTGYSSDIVEQTLGIPKETVNAALNAAGYKPDGQQFTPEEMLGSAVFSDSPMALIDVKLGDTASDSSSAAASASTDGGAETIDDVLAKSTDDLTADTTASTIDSGGLVSGEATDIVSGTDTSGMSNIDGLYKDIFEKYEKI